MRPCCSRWSHAVTHVMPSRPAAAASACSPCGRNAPRSAAHRGAPRRPAIRPDSPLRCRRCASPSYPPTARNAAPPSIRAPCRSIRTPAAIRSCSISCRRVQGPSFSPDFLRTLRPHPLLTIRRCAPPSPPRSHNHATRRGRQRPVSKAPPHRWSSTPEPVPLPATSRWFPAHFCWISIRPQLPASSVRSNCRSSSPMPATPSIHGRFASTATIASACGDAESLAMMPQRHRAVPAAS